MSKLSKSSIYAIKYLYSQGLDAEKISQELNLSVDSVQTIINLEPVQENKQPTPKDLMITKTAGKNTNNVAIMTKEASMLNDHQRTKNYSTKTNTDAHIFQPFKK